MQSSGSIYRINHSAEILKGKIEFQYLDQNNFAYLYQTRSNEDEKHKMDVSSVLRDSTDVQKSESSQMQRSVRTERGTVTVNRNETK